MNAAEIVVHGVQGNAVRMVLDLLGERIGEASKAAHGHTHGEIVPLDIAGRDMVGVWTPFDGLLVDARAFCGGVFLGMTFLGDVVTKGLDKHTVVYIPTKRTLDGIELGSEPVRGQFCTRLSRRAQRSSMNSIAVSEERSPRRHAGISLVSAQTAVHVQTSPDFGGGFLADATFLSLQ